MGAIEIFFQMLETKKGIKIKGAYVETGEIAQSLQVQEPELIPSTQVKNCGWCHRHNSCTKKEEVVDLGSSPDTKLSIWVEPQFPERDPVPPNKVDTS